MKEIKGIQIRREEIKLSLFTEEMTVCMKNLTDFINMHTHIHLLELISDISMITGYKANTHKIIVFLYLGIKILLSAIYVSINKYLDINLKNTGTMFMLKIMRYWSKNSKKNLNK